MRILDRKNWGLCALVGVLVGLTGGAHPAWGQTAERIGTVLAVDGTAEVRLAKTETWQTLRFRDALFPQDTVRTAANGLVKVLLRDDTILTLAERSEMQFTEFLLTPQQRRTIVGLTLGKLRVVTTKIFGAGSATEVRTPNTVAGVRGTTFIIAFVPPDITQVFGLDGVVSVQHLDPAIPQLEPVPPNFQTQVTGRRAPARVSALSAEQRRSLESTLFLKEQVPFEVKPTGERGAQAPPRGGGTTVADSTLAPRVTPLAGAVPGVRAGGEGEGDDPAFRARDARQRLSSEPAQRAGGLPLITPDNPRAAGALQQPNIRLTIRIPR